MTGKTPHPTSEVRPARCSSAPLITPGLCQRAYTEVRTHVTLPLSWPPSYIPQQMLYLEDAPSSYRDDVSLQRLERPEMLQQLLLQPPPPGELARRA